MRTYKLLGVKL